MEAKESSFAYVEDQLVHVTKGVLPRYKVQVSKKQMLAEQARMRYASPLNLNKDSSSLVTHPHSRRRQISLDRANLYYPSKNGGGTSTIRSPNSHGNSLVNSP